MLLYEVLAIFAMLPGVILVEPIPKIAIIGGGIGGTSCAYFLRQLFQRGAFITLFERDTIGGRLRVLDFDGNIFEAGGSIIHHRNQYMVQFAKLLGLGMRQPQPGKFGIYDGEKFVFRESDWYFLTIAELLWHYGFSLFQLYKDIDAMLNEFNKVYRLQQSGYAYTTVEELLNALNPEFTNLTKSSISQILSEKGYSHAFLDEYVQSAMMVNYGQTNNISGFAGYVALAGAESNLWSVDGGNKLVPEGLLKFSESVVVKSVVQEVALLSDNRFSVKYRLSASNQVRIENFDAVILSAPLIKGRNNIKFVNFSKEFQQYERPYHQTVATFVKGALRPSAFNKRSSVPDDILTNNNNLLFNSIGKCTPVDNRPIKYGGSVYKVFSQKPLNNESVEELFKPATAVMDKVWLAYPQYEPPENFPPFVFHPRLYYTSAIELSASAMEMSIIAAKNVALLMFNSWRNIANKIDAAVPILKEEL